MAATPEKPMPKPKGELKISGQKMAEYAKRKGKKQPMTMGSMMERC